MKQSSLCSGAESSPFEGEESLESLSPATRRQARELALKALYALELSGNPLERVINETVTATDDTDPIARFAIDIIEKTYNARAELDGHIRRRSKNWDFNRIAVIDKIVLRMAICEFLLFRDVPPKVSIDEAIELAKIYSTEKSGSFINGILDAVLDELKVRKELIKVGRGLQQSKRKKGRA